MGMCRILSVAVVLAALPCLAATTSRKAVGVHFGAGPLDSQGATAPVAATITRGKPKHVLKVTASLGVNGSPSNSGIFVRASVNGGNALEPAVFFDQQLTRPAALAASNPGTCRRPSAASGGGAATSPLANGPAVRGGRSRDWILALDPRAARMSRRLATT